MRPDSPFQPNTVQSFADAPALAEAAAGIFLETLQRSAAKPGPITVALSGGRIAQPFYSAIRRMAPDLQRLFARVHFFWADERCVPPDSPESNFYTAEKDLLAPLSIPSNQVHRIRAELGPDRAAQEAEAELERLSADPLSLVVLGLGEDGHIASLFPGRAGDSVRAADPRQYVAVYDAPKPPPERVSLSLGALAGAAEALVLISGSNKSEPLARSLQRDHRLPFGQLLGLRNRTQILFAPG